MMSIARSIPLNATAPEEVAGAGRDESEGNPGARESFGNGGDGAVTAPGDDEVSACGDGLACLLSTG